MWVETTSMAGSGIEDHNATSAITYAFRLTPLLLRHARVSLSSATIRAALRLNEVVRHARRLQGVTCSRQIPIPALRAQLYRELRGAIDRWKTPELCYFLRVGQPRVSNLRSGQIERFSLEQLIRFLERMNFEVTVSVRERRRSFRPAARPSDARDDGAGGVRGNA